MTVLERSSLRLLALVLVCTAIVVPFSLNRMPSPDLWWDLSNGRLMAELGRIPSADVFSFTAEGGHWQNDEWLVCRLFYEVYRLGGLGALYTLKVVLAGLTLFLLVWHAARRAKAPAWLAAGVGAACLAFSQYRAFFDVRPYLFSYLFLALFWVLVYRFAESRDTRLCWAFPLLTAVWVNLHAGVTAGIVMVGVAAVGMALEKEYRDLSRPLLLAALACLPATGLNPNGFHILTYPFRLLNSIWSRHLNEWQPLFAGGGWRDGIAPYLIFLGATLLLFLVLRRELRVYEMLVLGAFAFLSFTGWRHVPLFCWLAIFPWTVAAGRFIKAPELPGRAWAAVGTLAVLFLGWTVRTTEVPLLSMESQMFPRWAVRFLEANNLPSRLFAPYGWGGYLGWKLYPDYRVFIDGRAVQVYPEEIYEQYLEIAFGGPRGHELLNRWGVDTALVFRNPRVPEGSSQLFEDRPDWVRIYEDHLAAVFVRRPALKGQELVRPPNPYNLTAQAREALLKRDMETASRALQQALELDPFYAEAYLLQGVMALGAGRGAEGVALVERALELDPALYNAHYVLAAHFAETDPARARREARAELRVNPESEPARKLLQRL